MGDVNWILRGLTTGAAFVLLFSLAACGAAEDPPTSAEPIDDESVRLLAAEDAFTTFNAAFDGYSSGTAPIESLEPLVTADYFKVLREQDPAFSEQRVSGVTSFDTVELAKDPPRDDLGKAEAITLCRDLSRTEVRGPDGSTIDAPERMLRVPLIVYFVPADTDPLTLLVAEMDQWPSPDYCS
ncbi:hypothetical protein [Labedella endophytica]|uniref:Uncharacterized protein n=1 Tax=Labedella endophytica TaxID=1523160 RepID=A0A433JNI3_9MICO|nr:hypothetical protein [Labedella endophytica]RUQ97502.1 hypothetical protein ELQ94_15090 [Labedella endophytica]